VKHYEERRAQAVDSEIETREFGRGRGGGGGGGGAGGGGLWVLVFLEN
jgi:hypothetical protein